MRAGLEVHQQLATTKLFCECPSELTEVTRHRVLRQLRATGGENQVVDAAAAFESARGLTFEYETTESDCLVELDEEPPHALNAEALDVALTMALLLGARPLDEIEVMRKIVVDGSNTSGFQRTALVAVDGTLMVGERTYSVPTICLEEDAARKVAESGREVRYRLDRLGIPLIEIATGPEITSGAEARAVAEEIGALLRATRRARRGIGSIREDLNVSTDGGTRVEIKGVQELRLLQTYAETEEERQRALLGVRDELVRRGASVPSAFPSDVSELVRPTATGAIKTQLERGGVVLALSLPGFEGLLKSTVSETERLGRELADYARATGSRGLLHSDEVPSQGIDEATAARIRAALGGTSDGAFVLLAAGDAAAAQRGLETVRERAQAALRGVPPETRDPTPEGRSRYSRPLPGRDRMYPETDVPPVRVTPDHLERLRAALPERPAATRERFHIAYGLTREIAHQLVRDGEAERFERLAQRGHAPAAVARLLTQDVPAVEAEGGSTAHSDLSLEVLGELMATIERGEVAKEAIRPVLTELLRGAPSVVDAVARTGISAMSRPDLERLAEEIVRRNERMVVDRGPNAFSPLMGDLMREVRGRRDGQEVASVLRAALARRSSTGTSTAPSA